MAIRTTKQLSKKEMFAKYKTFHKDLFKLMGVEEPLFIPKIFWSHSAMNKTTITIYKSEFDKNCDIYTESVDTFGKLVTPSSGKRTLYKLTHNKFYNTEYPLDKQLFERTGVTGYLVDIDELIDCNELIAPPALAFDEFKIDSPDADVPYSAMTLRDYACIKLGVPQSFKPWLNDIIKSKSK